MNTQPLQSLGLTEKQIAIYLCVIEQGKATPGAIAKATRISRPTVYTNIAELIKLGLVEEGIGSKSFYVTAASPKSLKSIIEKQKREIESREKSLGSIIQELQSLRGDSGYHIPHLRFVEHNDMKDFMGKQIPIWIENSKETSEYTWWGIQDHTLVEQYPEWFNKHWELSPVETGTCIFTNAEKSEIEFNKKLGRKNRLIKYWDPSLPITTTQVVLGDYILIAQTAKNPHYLIEIYDRSMATNMRQVFRSLWNSRK
jgi:predicted DNA-binding transcriptional regulator